MNDAIGRTAPALLTEAEIVQYRRDGWVLARSLLGPRALQYHYHQTGAVWAGVPEHQRLFHFGDGSYAGCTVPHEPADASAYWYRGALSRPVVPEEPWE
jgi:hypothetical protein